jgi:hypothetical protein
MRDWTRILVSIAAVCVVGSCANGGIGGSGGISGFGSIFVNGTEWFTDGSEITLDGVEGSEDDLKLGMIVTFKGHAVAPGVTARATHVAFDDAIQGPVANIQLASPDAAVLEILGRTVFVHRSATHFDDSEPGFGFDSLALDDVLEVSGHFDANGNIHATWLRLLTVGSTQVELEGTISNLAGNTSFEIGSITIEITPHTELVETDTLEDGLAVEVEGTLISPNTVSADRIAPPDGLPEGVGELSLEGIVTGFVGIENFQVLGQPIDATDAEFEPPDPSILGPGMLVQVDGKLVDGILIAKSVKFVEDEVEIRAEIALASDIDSGGNRITLLGVEVLLADEASLEDARNGIVPFGLEDLSAGDFVEVRGVSSPVTGLIATEVRRTDTQSILVRAPLSSADGNRLELSVLGIAIPVDEQTELAGSLAEFFASPPIGLVVEVTDESDSDDSAIDTATQIEVAE